MTKTSGQALATEIRTMFHIGTRTRWYRKTSVGTLTRDAITERVATSINYPGYDNAERTAIFSAAFMSLLAYAKFVDGFRIDGELRARITTASPAEFADFLGDMVDSGCANMGEFEGWFGQQRMIAA